MKKAKIRTTTHKGFAFLNSRGLRDTAHNVLRVFSAQIAVGEAELEKMHRIHGIISDLCDAIEDKDAEPPFKATHPKPTAADIPPWENPGKLLGEVPMRSKKKRGSLKKASKRKYTKKSSWWKNKK